MGFENGPSFDSTQQHKQLIEKEPSPAMKLSIVVPTFAEYENGNIFRLIESFTKQSAPPETYEILCLVNNTPEAARAHSKGYQENQMTLALTKYLQDGGKLPAGLNAYRKTVLEKAREKGIVFHVVDFSSGGIEKNIGKIRDIGVTEATRRFRANGRGKEGLIAQLDADTVVEPRYVEKILGHFSDPEVESLFVNLEYATPEGNEELFKTSFRHQYQVAMQQWFNVLKNSKKVEVGGPQTIAKVKAYQRVGGIVHQDMAEDFELAKALGMQTAYKFAPDTRVYTSDRARVEGYDAKMRLEQMTDDVGGIFSGDVMYMSPRPVFLQMELGTMAKMNPNIFGSQEVIRACFEKYAIPYDSQKFKAVVLDAPSKDRDGHERPVWAKVAVFTINYLEELGVPIMAGGNEYANDALAVLTPNFAPEETQRLNALIRQNTLRASTRLAQSRAAVTEAVKLVFKQGNVSGKDFGKNLKTQEFIERNPWFIEKINAIRQTHESPEKAMEELKKEFPEWVESFERSGLRKATAVIHALTSYLREARNEPAQFPTTIEFLNKLKR